VRDVVEFLQRDADLRLCPGGLEGFRDYLSGGAHRLDLAGRLDLDHGITIPVLSWVPWSGPR